MAATISIGRRDLADHLIDNPSLKAALPDSVRGAYGRAVLSAVAETDLPESSFPDICPWTMEQIMDEGFWPSDAARVQ